MTTPDWDTISHEVTCPQCSYSLRGLTEPRCPECGHRFRWASVLFVRKNPRLLYDEFPADRNWLSFPKTWLRSLFPRRLRGSTQTSNQLVAARLYQYQWRVFEITAALTLIPLLVILIRELSGTLPFLAWFPAAVYLVGAAVGEFFPPLGAAMILIASFCLLWPLLTFLSLLPFRLKVEGRRIDRIQLFRCAVYSSSVMILLAVAFNLCVYLESSAPVWPLTSLLRLQFPNARPLDWLTLQCVIVTEVILTWRMVIALHKYIGTSSGWWITIFWQIVVCGVMIVLTMITMN